MLYESGLITFYVLLTNQPHKILTLLIIIMYSLSAFTLMDKRLFKTRINWRPIIRNKDHLFTLLNRFVMPLSISLLLILEHHTTVDSVIITHYSILGKSLLFIGASLYLWVLASNPYYVITMSLQYELGHIVIQNGPYLWIRHPGYLASIFSILSIPLITKSWLIIPFCILWILGYILRTHIEDQMLMRHFKGYYDYSRKTKYKLVPFIW